MIKQIKSYLPQKKKIQILPLNDLWIVLSHRRSIEEGGLWSLTLENYIHTNNLANTNSAALRQLYNTEER